MRKSWIFGIIAVLGIIFAIILYNIYNKKKIDIQLEDTAFKVHASAIFNEFEQDETVANKKYIGKAVEIKGKIGEITISQDKNLMIILKEKDDIFGINCMLNVKDIKSNDYLVGDSIKIKGIVQGYLSDVIVNNCIIIK